LRIKFDTDQIRYIAIFESITGAAVKDCVVNKEDNRVTFVVSKGEIGKAIGRGGSKIRRLRELIGKPVDIIEYSDDPEQFIVNVFQPAKIKKVHISDRKDGRKVALVEVSERDKGRAIGKGGKNIERAKALVKRHHEIDDILIL